MHRKADQSISRAINQRVLLDSIRRAGAISRKDLAAETGLSAGAVTMLVQDFIDTGLVSEGEASRSSGGRKPIPVSINYQARWSIGIKLREGALEGTLTDLSCSPLRSRTVLVDKMTPQVVTESIQTLVTELQSDCQGPAPLVGLGIALPGFIDSAAGVVRQSQRLGWLDVPLAAMVSHACDVPVWVENDTNAYAMAHRLFGAAQNAESLLAVVLGTGLGAALIVDGRIHTGSRFMAGEIGFYNSPEFGPLSLGAMYTLGGLTSGWQHVSGIPLQEALSLDDPQAVGFVREAGRKLGAIVGLLTAFVDPDVLLLGGETLDFGQHYRDALVQSIRQSAFNQRGTIALDLDNNLWTRGAAVLAVNHFFAFEGTNHAL